MLRTLAAPMPSVPATCSALQPMRTPQSAPEGTAAAESETATRSEPPPGDCTRTRATPCRPSAWPAERMKPITPQRHATSSNPPRNPSGTRGSNNSQATATPAALIALLILMQPEPTLTAHPAHHPYTHTPTTCSTHTYTLLPTNRASWHHGLVHLVSFNKALKTHTQYQPTD